ncbi:MAG: GMC family oxidoreductase [Actinobacteria bacterium]|nr:GMC family oxidoreductase [Actinomycetota bacterium]
MNATEPDVLVIGAGAAGAALTWRLASKGASVVCLEEGDWVDRDTIPKGHVDWEVRGRHYWNPAPSIRDREVDYAVTNGGENPVDPFMYSAVGGSTIGFGAQYWRLQPSDFRARTLDDFGVDWPIAYEDLAPYYDINERETGVSGLAGDPTGPQRPAPPLPPNAMGSVGRRWAAGFEKLGWYWWPQDSAIISRDYRGRAACTNRSQCAFGCPQKALSTADVTYWPVALELGAELRVRARVRRVILDTAGRAVGVEYYDADGRLQEQRAKRVVICAGGIGTPRLLLMSASATHPDGLANSSGQVGRNFMVHCQTLVAGRFEEPTESYAGTVGSMSSRQFYETDPDNDFVRGFIVAGNRGYSPLLTALQFRLWGGEHHEKLEHHLNHDATVYVCGDDEPEEHNRVELDHGRLDDFGLPGVTTSYTMSENSRRMTEAAIGRATELCMAAGADSVRDFGVAPGFGWHLLGTARMGADAGASVVDADHRAHDVPGLYIADGSSMPTGGAVNPAHTIQALALRAADRIWEGRNDG